MAQGSPEYGLPDECELPEWFAATYEVFYDDDDEELAKSRPMQKALRKKLKISDAGGLRQTQVTLLGGALSTVLEPSEVPGMVALFLKWLGKRGKPHKPPGVCLPPHDGPASGSPHMTLTSVLVRAGETALVTIGLPDVKAPPRFGKVGAGATSNSPNFKEAMRPAPGIDKKNVVTPPWVDEAIEQARLAHQKALARGKMKTRQLTTAVHAMATFSVNEYGVNVASNIPGFYGEMGQQLAEKVLDEAHEASMPLDHDAVQLGKTIQTRAGAFKRGGTNGSVVPVVISRVNVKSPLRALEAAGKITISSPEQGLLAGPPKSAPPKGTAARTSLGTPSTDGRYVRCPFAYSTHLD